MRADESQPRDVVVLIDDGMAALDATGPMDVFAFAGALGGRYRVRTASPGGAPVRTASGLRISPDLAAEDVRGPIDTLLVTGGGETMSSRPGAGPMTADVRRIAGCARRVVSVCVGAFVLGAAGLLEGRRATTHWYWCDLLAERHPRTTVVPDAIFVRDGRVATSAGISAGMDLALALVEEDHGAEVAREVAKLMVLFLQRPGGQSQFSVWSRLPAPRHPALRKATDAVLLDPAADHCVPALARRASVSIRHLNRLFSEKLGTTAAGYVEQVRVQTAQTLLESTEDGLELVARRAGFGSQETMRRAFLRLLGVSPGGYRSRFRSSIPSAGIQRTA
ncbi:GlxA family transcriptional regulator [Amycolatopsis nigrescens]|uniref:GlxA family transcriptional regulator n=1 Tax=Amycolatopsis nigrescens TaxID=381445 RepID=UPI001FE0E027|nr:GlxA family transcriptional regulator [Amycolatopsis nigrescens]